MVKEWVRVMWRSLFGFNYFWSSYILIIEGLGFMVYVLYGSLVECSIIFDD